MPFERLERFILVVSPCKDKVFSILPSTSVMMICLLEKSAYSIYKTLLAGLGNTCIYSILHTKKRRTP